MRAQYSPVDGDGHHVHQGGRHVAVEEEGEDPAQRGAQGPGLMYIPRQQLSIGYNTQGQPGSNTAIFQFTPIIESIKF